MKNPSWFVFFAILIPGLVLGACSGQPEATTLPMDGTQPVPSPTAQAEQSITETAYPAPVNSQAAVGQSAYPEPAVGSAAAGQVVYHIVPGESQVTYEVGEVFIREGNVFKVAVGVTKQVSGDITIDFDNPQNSTIGTITVDISQFTSDSTRRDNVIRESWLQSSLYPLATFQPTKIEGLPASGAAGVEYPLLITGDLTVRDVTKPVTFEARVRWENGTLFGTATATILMSDFGVGPIDIAGILKTNDEVLLKLSLVARP